MEIIKSMIKNEKKAMSDDNLTRELNKKGYSLARRTITKYRMKLGLPSSRKRRKTIG
jgi:RNA polymerase sigma-54 factor